MFTSDRLRRDHELPTRPEIVRHRARVAEARTNGIDVIDLGFADVRGEPPLEAMEELQQHIASNLAIHHYGEVGGITTLREAIAEYLSKNGSEVDPKNVTVTAGANHAVVLSLLATTAPGDSIIIPTPSFFNHVTQILLVGCKPAWLNTHASDHYALPSVSAWNRAFSEPRIAAVLLTQPRNPTATQIEDAELERVLALAEKHLRPVIVDESYAEFHSGKYPRYPIGSKALVRVGSFSKSFCLAGWRIGYLVAPDDLQDRVRTAQDALMIHPAIASQHMALASLSVNSRMSYVDKSAQEIARRRALVKHELRDCKWIDRIFADAGTFVWIVLKKKNSAEHMTARMLSECGIAVLSGQGFAGGGEDCLRLGVACSSIDRLKTALERLINWQE